MVWSFRFVPKKVFLVGCLASSIVTLATLSQAAQVQGKDKPGISPAPVSTPVASPAPITASAPTSGAVDLRSTRENLMYRRIWGIENIHLRETASGSIIKFSYRVVDANKAKVLNDAKLNPILSDANSGEKLSVPETENAGKLRQVADPVNGREYWMVFLNNSRIIRAGSRVDIKIGPFHADGLVVEPSMPTQPALAQQKP